MNNDFDKSVRLKDTILLARIACSGWLVAKLITYRLWFSNRQFPLLPPWQVIQFLPWLHIGLFIASMLLLTVILIRPAKPLLLCLFIIEIISCLADVNRWQPWQYLYLTIIFIALLNWKRPGLIKLNLSFVLISTYFFSGLSKWNGGFIDDVWVQIVLRRFLHVPTHYYNSTPILYAGYTISIIEMFAALLLIKKTTRIAGASILILTCVFNLVLLGPFGINYNVAVWPWNATMIALLYVLYLYLPEQLKFSFLLHKKQIWLLILWGFLPVTNMFGLWDDFLSSAIYSGKAKHLYVCIDTLKTKTPKELIPFTTNANANVYPNAMIISVEKWSLADLNVPFYPEERVFKRFAKILRMRYPNYKLNFYLVERKRITELFE